jgi:signal transduction histidine kinase
MLAAQLLGERGEGPDIVALRQARERELDHHVQRAIDQALNGSRGRSLPLETPDRITAPDEQEGYAEVFQSVSKMLVHELRDLVGYARLDLARELSDVRESRAIKSVERIGELLDAIEQLGDLPSNGESEPLDLSDVAMAACERERKRLSVAVESAGPDSAYVVGNRMLIDLALAKAIENAAESTVGGPAPRSPVVVNWGVTDRGAWFAVIDDGVGLAPGIDAFAFGRSSKIGHLGVGLTLASKAIGALGGTVILEPNATGGATLRAAWPVER